MSNSALIRRTYGIVKAITIVYVYVFMIALILAGAALFFEAFRLREYSILVPGFLISGLGLMMLRITLYGFNTWRCLVARIYRRKRRST